jgi:adenylate cyclase
MSPEIKPTPDDFIIKKWSELTPEIAWHMFLHEGYKGFARIAPPSMRIYKGLERALLQAIPTNPRCVSCAAPFFGVGAPLMRMMGRQRSSYNASLCADCENMAIKYHTQAEVPLTMLFADIRGSTAMAEKMAPTEFSALINRFYQVIGDILVDAKAMVDKFKGDEVSAYFVPGLVGKQHSLVAIEVGKEILKQTAAWIPVGVGIHSGPAIVGALGKEGQLNEITVLGDTANTAARLASVAKAGEIVASEVTVAQAGIDIDGLEKEDLMLKGKDNPVTVWHISLDNN